MGWKDLIRFFSEPSELDKYIDTLEERGEHCLADTSNLVIWARLERDFAWRRSPENFRYNILVDIPAYSSADEWEVYKETMEIEEDEEIEGLYERTKLRVEKIKKELEEADYGVSVYISEPEEY